MDHYSLMLAQINRQAAVERFSHLYGHRDGMLAAQLRVLKPGMIMLYLTEDPEVAATAIRQKVDYVIFKPARHGDVSDAMERASLLMPRQRKLAYASVFGSFDLNIGGSSVQFRSAKARELMALLVCRRGRPVSIHEIVDCLWEKDAMADVNSVGYRKAIKSLADTLADYGAQRLLVRSRGYCRLRAELVDCDYYAFLAGDRRALQLFQGVFLPEYAWAESYIYPLLEIKQDQQQVLR